MHTKFWVEPQFFDIWEQTAFKKAGRIEVPYNC